MLCVRIALAFLSTAFYGCAVDSNATNRAVSTAPASQSFDLCPINTQGNSFALVKTQANWNRLLKIATVGATEINQWRPDFGSQVVVVYQIGKRPSLGYKPELVRVDTSNAKRIDLWIKQNLPAGGLMQAKVVSQPCMLALIAFDPNVQSPQVILFTDVDTGTVLGQVTSKESEFFF
jgi:hypothetical protein